MSKIQCMIDLETMSTRPTSLVLSIGAVKFDGSKITDRFKVNIAPKSYAPYGNQFHVSPDTIKWWGQQSKEARDAWTSDPVPVVEAFQQFAEWYGSKSMWTWGNGSAFDISILENAFSVLELPIPWKYYDVMCMRTISNMMGKKVDRSHGVFHDALVDAENQANFLIQVTN